MTANSSAPPVTITLTRYREPDWLVNETLDSLARQQGVTGEVIFLDQQFSPEFAKQVEARSTRALKFSCLPCEEKGLSFARNQGLARAVCDIVLFLDSDAVADPRWARALADALASPGVAIAGGRILPVWRGAPPLLAKSNVVLDQYSLLDWGEDTFPAPRIVGAGFALRKSAAPGEMHFDESLGRRDGKLFGGEESDLCARVWAAGGAVIYCGGAVIRHQILPDRLRWSWVMRRLYYAGLARAQAGGAPAPSRKPGFWDWALLPFILPPYAAGYALGRRMRRAKADP
jgi:GT2 family glycosyltransferase